ncbi:MAG: hypothetical protein H6832_12385 [Planctomycetes bacterium]|nr:hypothetical protein [Planctomycetota bacterium]MCB9891973.1 hypothetical protein [Planctomycetota bacterium]MCB9919190.1 hypothetical protein [Planctomycetota bacterium]
MSATRCFGGLAAALSTVLASCGVVAFPEKTHVTLSPVYGSLVMNGTAKMESGSVASGKTANGTNDLRHGLNVADRDTALGGTIGYGDSFAGVEFGYLHFAERSFDTQAVLQNDFGALVKDDAIQSELEFEQWTLEYIVRLFDFEPVDKLTIDLGAGIGIHHNTMTFDAKATSVTTPRNQHLAMQDDGMPILRARADASWRRLRGRLDLGYSDGHWRNIDGKVVDLELSVAYDLTRDVRAFASWRRYDLPFAGGQDGLDYAFDAKLEGFYFGLELRF